MKFFLRYLLLLILIGAWLYGGQNCKALPPTPAQYVHDPGDVWTPEEEARLTQLSNAIFQERRFRLYFVAIGARETDAPETAAEEFSRGWLQGAPGAVFISLLNRPALGVSVGEGKQSRPTEDRITDTRLYLWEHRADPSTASSLGDAAQGLVRDLKLYSAPIVTRTADSETYSLPLNWPLITGIAGSIVATYLGTLVGWYREGDKAGFIMSVAGALLLLAIYHMFRKKTG